MANGQLYRKEILKLLRFFVYNCQLSLVPSPHLSPPSPNTQPAAQQGGGASTLTVQGEGTGAMGAAAAAEAAAFATNKKRLMVHKSPGVKATGKGSKTYTQT